MCSPTTTISHTSAWNSHTLARNPSHISSETLTHQQGTLIHKLETLTHHPGTPHESARNPSHIRPRTRTPTTGEPLARTHRRFNSAGPTNGKRFICRGPGPFMNQRVRGRAHRKGQARCRPRAADQQLCNRLRTT